MTAVKTVFLDFMAGGAQSTNLAAPQTLCCWSTKILYC